MTTQSSQPSSQHWKTLATLAKYLWPVNRRDLKGRVILAVIFLVLGKLLNVYVPFLLKQATDTLSLKSDLPSWQIPMFFIVSYALARVLVQVFSELRDYVFSHVAQHAQRVISLDTFRHLHQLSLEFHLSRQTGGLSRVIERGSRGIQFVLHFMVFNIFPTLFEIILVTGVLYFNYGAIYAGIILGTIAIYILLTLVVTEWRLKFRKAMNHEETTANTKAIDSLLNFETVKYFGNEDHEYRRFDASLARYETAALKSQLGLSILNVTQASIIGIGLLLIMIKTGDDVLKGHTTIGDFILVNTFLIQLYLPLNFLGFIYREVKNSLVDMEKMFELLDTHSNVTDQPGALELKVPEAKLDFDQVHFSYLADRPILKNVSFQLPAGKTLAIVGPSGSGKSTMARLLFRFYNVSAGQIMINGLPVTDFTQASLRSHIGIVPQDTVLFNDTIGYNILYGHPSANREQMIQAAKMAQIHDFVMSLPKQYETEVGERGLKLSGGEKQRVAIARTILKNPPILIFDEATSALDSHNEKEIQAALKQVSKNRTTVMIAHRLSTVVDADEILVLVHGEVKERGTHLQLLQAKGEYAQLWQKQLQQQEL